MTGGSTLNGLDRTAQKKRLGELVQRVGTRRRFESYQGNDDSISFFS